jgi:hypothetical protein
MNPITAWLPPEISLLRSQVGPLHGRMPVAAATVSTMPESAVAMPRIRGGKGLRPSVNSNQIAEPQAAMASTLHHLARQPSLPRRFLWRFLPYKLLGSVEDKRGDSPALVWV